MSTDLLARTIAGQARVAAARQALKPAGLKMASFGHSFSAYGFYADASGTGLLDRCPLGWAAILSGQRLTIDPAENFGVAGQTIAQILARVPQVLGSDAGVIELWAGANDIWPYPQPVATMQATYAAILDQLTAAGKLVLALPLVPRLPTTAGFVGATTAQILDGQQRAEQFNRWLVDECARRRDVFLGDVLDMWTDLSTSSQLQPPGGTTPNSGSYTIDGLHPSSLGAFVLGMREADILTRLAPSRTRQWSPFSGTFDAAANPRGNLLVNPLIAGTTDGFAGMGVTGAVAHGWAATRYAGSAITATSSKVGSTLANGLTQSMNQFVLNNGGATAQSMLFYQQVTAASRYTPGAATLRGGLDVQVDAGSRLVGIRIGIAERDGGGTILSASQAPSFGDTSTTGAVLPAIAWGGRLRSPPLATRAAGVSVWLQAEMMVPAGGTATVRFGNGFLGVEG